jgi:hypothetical protein
VKAHQIEPLANRKFLPCLLESAKKSDIRFVRTVCSIFFSLASFDIETFSSALFEQDHSDFIQDSAANMLKSHEVRMAAISCHAKQFMRLNLSSEAVVNACALGFFSPFLWTAMTCRFAASYWQCLYIN